MKRRRFIHALGGLGAVALLPSCATTGAAQQGWIDSHHHFFSPEYQKAPRLAMNLKEVCP